MARCISTLIKRGLCLALCVLSVFPLRSQVRENTFQLGFGGIRVQDTYLSPLKYSGWQLSMFWMTERESGFLCQVQGQFSKTNAVGTVMSKPRMLGGGVSVDAGWHYRWRPTENLRLTLGALGGLYAGVLYNENNTNNPANAHANIRFSATVGARYSFPLWGRTWRVDYKADVPVIGVLFSPEYGQSYYEMSEYGMSGCFKPLWFGNGLNLRQQLSLDIPFKNFYLRVAYANDIRQQSVNDLKWHDWGHTGMIGFVRRFSLVKIR